MDKLGARNVGSVHGRFQPFHNDHLRYTLAASERVDYLLVGLTQPDIGNLHWTPGAMHRDNLVDNPLTYFERLVIIEEALVDAGLSRDHFSIVPFPIETPHKLPYFVDLGVPAYTTICEEWNRQKISMLEDVGYAVHVLWESKEKSVNGSEIRRQIAAGSREWIEAVPSATVRAIDEWNISERLARLGEEGLGAYE